jgi:hypothetical protein
MISINWHPTQRELRQFAGIWFPAFWLIVGLVIGFRIGWWHVVVPVWIAAAAFGVMGLVRPQLVRPVFVGWMVAAWPVGWALSHLMLAGVYYLLITPLGLVMRLAGRDKLQMKFDSSAATYWTPRPPAPPASRYFRQF